MMRRSPSRSLLLHDMPNVSYSSPAACQTPHQTPQIPLRCILALSVRPRRISGVLACCNTEDDPIVGNAVSPLSYFGGDDETRSAVRRMRFGPDAHRRLNPSVYAYLLKTRIVPQNGDIFP